MLGAFARELRDIIMHDVNDDAKAGFRRIEVLNGPARRRRWSDAEKARIVAETFLPGSKVSEVARRWQLSAQQIWGWRRQARSGLLVLPTGTAAPVEPDFVPIVTEEPPETPRARSGSEGAAGTVAVQTPVVEICLGEAVIRVARGTDCAWLAKVLRALRASLA